MSFFCPKCKERLQYIEPPDDPMQEYNENYRCPDCKALWLICYEGQED